MGNPMMKTRRNPLGAAPRFPAPLALPLGLIPARVHSSALAVMLNRIFAEPLADGELDFLADRVLEVRIPDARLVFRLTLRGHRLAPVDDKRPADTRIEGDSFDFLRLATRQEDADTLFFNRRLRFGGNTELGLHVKNFLDAFEPPHQLAPVMDGLGRFTRWVGASA